ncbi:MAG: adenosylhomocysteinase [Archaeoglobi archaeon]|nr:adenosylhomocysteinase [Candidatus Mnemosynella bozhongmuii]
MRSGEMKLEWARMHMKVLSKIREEFERERPLEGIVVGMALHVEAKTGVLAETLAAGGAEVHLTGCNPLSTQDDVAEALNREPSIFCYAKRGCDTREYYEAIDKVLDASPHILVDDGGDMITRVHTGRRDVLSRVIGATEETTTGVKRLKAMEREGALEFPVIAVNDARTKYLFDNRYGTGQSTWDALMRATNLLIAGKTVVVAGYGWCGRGIALRARGLGARVIITEVDPVRALEALMDGFEVMKMRDASYLGDIFITATGNRDIIGEEEFRRMKDGAILANAGHFNIEVDVETLRKISERSRKIRENIEEFLVDGKRIYLLAEGRLVNLAAGDGHPVEVMDMSFSNQALSVRFLVEKGEELDKRVYPVPHEIDERIARMKLETLGVEIDELSEEQIRYLSGWRDGT